MLNTILKIELNVQILDAMGVLDLMLVQFVVDLPLILEEKEIDPILVNVCHNMTRFQPI